MAGPKRRIDTLQTVELAEGMEIHLRTAGPFLRLIAWILDLVIEIIALMILNVGFNLIFPVMGGNVSQGIFLLSFFLIWWFYHVFFEISPWGATIGKRAFGLRVVNEAGGGITMGASMIRNFIRGVELLIPFAPLIVFFNPRFQRLGDLAAGTLVVYSKPRIDPVIPGPPPLEKVPVNLTLSREEEAAVLSFRYRSGGWSEARRMELANHLEKMTGEVGPKGVSKLMGMAHWLEEQR
ncbi:MAG: RDD family protein [Akkermansiaceae bacterium]|jgi:uncharacterized RDD family membrane protein YckC